MRSRTNRINVWLSDEELADLNEKASRVRGSRERFIRQCISGAAIREAPSVDVPKLIYEVRRVGPVSIVSLSSPMPGACWKCLNSAGRYSGTGNWKYVSWTLTRKTDDSKSTAQPEGHAVRT